MVHCVFSPVSASAVTPGKKVQLYNSKSTTRFSISSRWISYVVSKPPRGGGLKKQSVQNL